MNKTTEDLAVIAGVSAIAGSRTSLPYALLFPEKKAVCCMAGTELIVDKMPGVGDRIELPGVIGRSISGAVTGVILSKRRNSNPWLGGLIGAAAACAFTYASFYARKNICKATRLPDPLIGMAEDMLMIALGTCLMGKDIVPRKIVKEIL